MLFFKGMFSRSAQGIPLWPPPPGLLIPRVLSLTTTLRSGRRWARVASPQVRSLPLPSAVAQCYSLLQCGGDRRGDVPAVVIDGHCLNNSPATSSCPATIASFLESCQGSFVESSTAHRLEPRCHVTAGFVIGPHLWEAWGQVASCTSPRQAWPPSPRPQWR
eukprot:1178553-Prorocentrum_minimum.AAC.1